MADQIRIEDMNMSDEEKKLLIKALTDKKFRDELQRQADGDAQLSDNDLDRVVGGAGMSFSGPQLRNVLGIARRLDARITAGAEVLCGGGPCGIA
jgi:hypothetical protein